MTGRTSRTPDGNPKDLRHSPLTLFTENSCLIIGTK